MKNFLNKFYMFMQGRYGNDELNNTLFVLCIIIFIVSRLTPFYVGFILSFVELGILALIIFRFLSKNIYKRMAENKVILPAYRAVTDWFKLTYKRFRDGRTHRYYKCPKCKAQLRVKNVKGKHTIRCPKCGNQFEKKIR